ncbi:MAG: DUF4020 domain-containing protein [Ruminiclostridium sp.]|nr:DUF4020 domain-containing protein [Ruminiclostridium sp.]
MNINDIEIPERVLLAQQENKLVIFAGAGISVDPPSNLPKFEQLAAEVANKTFCKRKENEPIDTYLGRVYHEGKNIYEIIGNILSDDKSRYNDYHFNLLKLFPEDKIKLVTTNQDTHFTSAANKIFLKKVKIYYAPMLPLVKSFDDIEKCFAGIVYLHGNVADNLKNMVFTDSDFGEAYLVEGWASRFLKDLFSYYTILFIGYSYQDPVMKYFARGMQYNENRFIFTCRDGNTDDHWQRLHITPIYYNKKNHHKQLLECIRNWAKLYSLDYTGQKERLKYILASKTTLMKEEKDYLFYMISKEYGVDFFCELAHDYNWFMLLFNEGKLEFIFKEKQELSYNDMRLICWVVEVLLISNIEEFLIILAKKGNYINPYFTNRVLRFFYDKKKEEKDKNKTLLTLYHYQLLALMLHQPYKIEDKSTLGSLLLELKMPEDINIILLLFKYLIKPEIKLEKSFRFISNEKFKDSTDIGISIFGELYWLEKAWEEILFPNVHLIAEELIVTVTEYLKYFYLFFERNSKSSIDTLSYMRSSIEKHEQDQYGNTKYFLIDMTRDIINYLISNNISMCDSIVNIWGNSKALLLERLSIFTIQKAIHISYDRKISWLLEKGWLFKPGAKKEIFDLIKFTYTYLTPKMRRKLIEEIANPPPQENNEHQDHEIYNFLAFLNNCFPKEKKIRTEFNKIGKRYPTFKPSEHPEFDSWMGTGNWEGMRSPKTKKELLSEDPVNIIEWILKYRELNKNEHGWFDLMRELTGAVGDNKDEYDWTEKLILELEKRNELRSDIFESIIQGLEKEPISPALLKRLLNLIEINYFDFNADFKKQISWFILKQVDINKETIKAINVDTIIYIVQNIYSYHKKNDINNDAGNNSDNFTYPHISVASNIMMSVFKLFTIIMEEDKKLDTDQANTLFDFIEEVAFNKSFFSVNALPIIAVDYAFINYYRPELSHKMIVLFDIDNNKEYARAMWHGFLDRGNYNDGIIKKLFNNYKKLFSIISQEDKEIIKAFCFKAVGIAIYCEIEEIKDKKWIFEMIKTVTDNVRVCFAELLKRELFKLDAKKADQLWEDWICAFWDNRNRNIPVGLSIGEIQEMMYWVICFDKYFDKAVELITQKSIPFHMNILSYIEHEDRNLLKKHPNGVAKYFFHLIKNVSINHQQIGKHFISDFSEKILKCEIDIEIKQSIEQQLERLSIKVNTTN